MRPAACAAALAVTALTAIHAQIGSPLSAFTEAYGPPVRVATNEAGLETAFFSKPPLEVEANLREGSAIRLTYRKPALSADEAEEVLERNRQNALWTPWSAPGAASTNGVRDTWFRSDEGAMARLAANALTIESGGAPAPAAPAPQDGTLSTNSEPPAPPASFLPPPPPPEPAYRISPPRPIVPKKLPRPGDGRDTVTALLGKPLGEVRSGPRTILLYPWGHVTMEADEVVRIDNGAFGARTTP